MKDSIFSSVIIVLLIGVSAVAVAGWMSAETRIGRLTMEMEELKAGDAKLKAADAGLEAADERLNESAHKYKESCDFIILTLREFVHRQDRKIEEQQQMILQLKGDR